MPQGGKTALKRWLAQERSHVLKRRPDLAVLANADSTADNWTFLSGLMPDAEALDFFQHAASPGAWFRRWRQVPRDEPGVVIRLIRAIRGLRVRAGNETARQDLTRVLNSFCEHRHRMRYHEVRAQGMVIGSGTSRPRIARTSPSVSRGPGCAGGSPVVRRC